MRIGSSAVLVLLSLTTTAAAFQHARNPFARSFRQVFPLRARFSDAEADALDRLAASLTTAQSNSEPSIPIITGPSLSATYDSGTPLASLADVGIPADALETAGKLTSSLESVVSSSASYAGEVGNYFRQSYEGTAETAPLLYEYITKNVKDFVMTNDYIADLKGLLEKKEIPFLSFPENGMLAESVREDIAASFKQFGEILSSADYTAIDRRQEIQDIIDAWKLNEQGVWYATFLTLAILIYYGNLALQGDLLSGETANVTAIVPPAANGAIQDVSLVEIMAELKKLREERGIMESNFAALKSEILSLKETVKSHKATEQKLRSELEKAEKVKEQQQKQLEKLGVVQKTVQEEVKTSKKDLPGTKSQSAPKTVPATSPSLESKKKVETNSAVKGQDKLPNVKVAPSRTATKTVSTDKNAQNIKLDPSRAAMKTVSTDKNAQNFKPDASRVAMKTVSTNKSAPIKPDASRAAMKTVSTDKNAQSILRDAPRPAVKTVLTDKNPRNVSGAFFASPNGDLDLPKASTVPGAVTNLASRTGNPGKPQEDELKKSISASAVAKPQVQDAKKIIENEQTTVAGKSAPASDWSQLSLASLKRKTIKDLSDYLKSKGRPHTDAKGIPLKKSDLIDAVLGTKV